MSEIQNSVILKFGYTNTESTRQYTIAGISNAALSGIESGIQAINASLAAGTDDGLSAFFRADDFDDSTATVVGAFNKITEARIESVEEVKIF